MQLCVSGCFVFFSFLFSMALLGIKSRPVHARQAFYLPLNHISRPDLVFLEKNFIYLFNQFIRTKLYILIEHYVFFINIHSM